MRVFIFHFSLFLIHSSFISAQPLRSGFDIKELQEVLRVSVRVGGVKSYYSDSNMVAEPEKYSFTYRSPEMGLVNMWELWTNGNQSAIIAIRGTVMKKESWLANFYSAMLPARGEIDLPGNGPFKYELATDSKAAVHAGWLIATGYLAKDILPKIDSCYKKGIKQFIVTGHSQGGAISYLLTAYLYGLLRKGELPNDIFIKTYCTAAPKPGNLFFAYDFETYTRSNGAFNIINPPDWVPESPISIQTTADFNHTNPFRDARKMIRKQKFPADLMLGHVYNRMEKPIRKAGKNQEKYLGRMLSKQVKKSLNGLEVGEYFHSSNYVRTGTSVILKPDSAYFAKYPEKSDNLFIHHFHHPYILLAEKFSKDEEQRAKPASQ